jgi:hypothetical protein
MTDGVSQRDCVPTKIYRPNSRSTSQPSNPLAASGRTDVRVGGGRTAPPADVGAGAAGALTCEDACTMFEKKPAACEVGKAATGTP